MPEEIKDLTDQSDLDTTAALADISTDLFGQGSKDGETGVKSADEGTEGTPAKSSVVEKAPSPQTQEPVEENAEAVQEVGAPKTWSKEALGEWATVPPRAQQEILKREEDFLNGITMYKTKAEIGDRYEAVVAPYAPILQSENIDPVQLFQSFSANHYLLSRGTESQKIELAANMIQGYGIDFHKLIDYVGNRIVAPQDPRLASLEQEIASLKQAQTSRQRQEQAEVTDRLSQEVQAFAADPAHPYFNELADDIGKLFETGQAASLQEAYEKAVYLNPTTRQKEIERLTATKFETLTASQQLQKDKIARSTAADLSVSPRSKNGTVPLGSIDDTLAETLARINSR